MKKEKLEFLMKFPMVLGIFCFAFVFVARYIRPILELKIPFNLDIISIIGVIGFGVSFTISLIYLSYSIIKFKKEKKNIVKN